MVEVSAGKRVWENSVSQIQVHMVILEILSRLLWPPLKLPFPYTPELSLLLALQDQALPLNWKSKHLSA